MIYQSVIFLESPCGFGIPKTNSLTCIYLHMVTKEICNGEYTLTVDLQVPKTKE
jgi:hypothetical protein